MHLYSSSQSEQKVKCMRGWSTQKDHTTTNMSCASRPSPGVHGTSRNHLTVKHDSTVQRTSARRSSRKATISVDVVQSSNDQLRYEPFMEPVGFSIIHLLQDVISLQSQRDILFEVSILQYAKTPITHRIITVLQRPANHPTIST